MSNLNTMHSGINSLVSDARICGPATTAAARAGDMLSTLKALSLAREGDVLVIDNQGDPDTAMWGEITTQEAQNRGVVALIVDGRVRDITPIRRMGFPIWARGTSPRVCSRESCGEVNVPISCGGTVVSPGDIIVADADGVVVVPQRQAPTVLEIGRDIMAYEERLRRKVAGGVSQVEIFALDAQFDELQEAHRARRST